VGDNWFLVQGPDSWRSTVISHGFTFLGAHRFTVSTNLSCLRGQSPPERFWIKILNLDYDLRGPKAIAAVVRPFGRLIKLDSPSLARSDLRWARGVVEVASRELIPPFLWFELLKSSGLVRHIQLRFEVEGSVLPPGVGTDSSGTDTIQPVST
jgi:hypothetical protein